jgi:hypothetical protein
MKPVLCAAASMIVPVRGMQAGSKPGRARARNEATPEQDLSRRGIQEVGAAYDIGDVLRGVVDHDGELVRPVAFGASEDEVANVARDVLLLGALYAVVKGDDGRVGDTQADGGVGPPRLRDTLPVDAAA